MNRVLKGRRGLGVRVQQLFAVYLSYKQASESVSSKFSVIFRFWTQTDNCSPTVFQSCFPVESAAQESRFLRTVVKLLCWFSCVVAVSAVCKAERARIVFFLWFKRFGKSITCRSVSSSLFCWVRVGHVKDPSERCCKKTFQLSFGWLLGLLFCIRAWEA